MTSPHRVTQAVTNSRFAGLINLAVASATAPSIVSTVNRSRLVSGLRCLRGAITKSASESHVSRWINIVFETGVQTLQSVVLTVTGWTAGDLVGDSLLYRWMTRDSEPEVVIDLRETITVGPAIIIFDRAHQVLGPPGRRSRVRRVSAHLEDVFVDAPIRLGSIGVLVAVAVSLFTPRASGALTSTGLFVRIVIAGIAILGIRVRTSWSDITASKPARKLVAVFALPDPTGHEEREDSANS